MWDCIKLEAGDRVTTGISSAEATPADGPIELFTIGGQKVGTFGSIRDLKLEKGIYIFRQGSRSGKVAL